MRQIRRWSGGLLAIGLLAYAWGAFDVMAAPTNFETALGPDWGTIAKLLFGVLVSGLSFYVKGLERRVTKIEERQDILRDSLLRDYHSKSEVKERFDKIDESVDALHRRLDFLRVPPAAHRRQDDGA